MDFLIIKFKKSMDEGIRIVLIIVKKEFAKPFRDFDKVDSRS